MYWVFELVRLLLTIDMFLLLGNILEFAIGMLLAPVVIGFSVCLSTTHFLFLSLHLDNTLCETLSLLSILCLTVWFVLLLLFFDPFPIICALVNGILTAWVLLSLN